MIINEFLSQFEILSKEDRISLANELDVRTWSKTEIIQQEGRVPKHCFFVLGGCVRQYKFLDGDEKTLEFYTKESAVIASEHYIEKTPSHFSLECVEDSILIVGSPERDEQIISDYPVLQTIMMEIAEKEWSKTKRRLSSFQLLSPKERYLEFLETRKDLKDRVPNHQIASYLGITPESLSRIRKRISTE